MNYSQNKLFTSATPTSFQILDHAEKFLFTNHCQKSETKLKFLFVINAARKILNKILSVCNFCELPENKIYFHKISRSSCKNLIPLIKSTTKLTSATSAVCASRHNKNEKNQIDLHIKCHKLSEKYVLCIGGRRRLYPEYRSLIESLGGNLLIYRGNQKGDSDRLPALLTCADMVICPVDCVKHETYFDVKHYCKKSGKPCALLDRSDLPTFYKGIKILIGSLHD